MKSKARLTWRTLKISRSHCYHELCASGTRNSRMCLLCFRLRRAVRRCHLASLCFCLPAKHEKKNHCSRKTKTGRQATPAGQVTARRFVPQQNPGKSKEDQRKTGEIV